MLAAAMISSEVEVLWASFATRPTAHGSWGGFKIALDQWGVSGGQVHGAQICRSLTVRRPGQKSQLHQQECVWCEGRR